MAELPHFAFPFQRDATGKVGVVEQNSPQHITNQQLAVVVTPLGYRSDRPDFGWEWPEFATIPLDLSSLRDAFTRLVPDADSNIEEWGDAADAAIRHVLVTQILSGEGVSYSSESTSGYGGATPERE